MASMMVDSTKQMIERWSDQISSGNPEIDVESEIIATAGEIIARTSFGMRGENAREVFKKLRALQMTLFKTTRYVGVPFGKCLNVKKTLEAKKLGKEIDKVLLSVIRERRSSTQMTQPKSSIKMTQPEQDLLGLLLKENGQKLTTRELVDECKTFFFAGHETTALAITWTLLLLAKHQEWQIQLREEIREVVGDNVDEIDINLLSQLKKVTYNLSLSQCIDLGLGEIWVRHQKNILRKNSSVIATKLKSKFSNFYSFIKKVFIENTYIYIFKKLKKNLQLYKKINFTDRNKIIINEISTI